MSGTHLKVNRNRYSQVVHTPFEIPIERISTTSNCLLVVVRHRWPRVAAVLVHALAAPRDRHEIGLEGLGNLEVVSVGIARRGRIRLQVRTKIQ